MARREYKQAVLGAHAEDTIHTTLFDIGWPDAAHRVIRTPTVETWERAGRPSTGERPGEGEAMGAMHHPSIKFPLVRYAVTPPTEYIEGDISGLAFYAGQSCSLVKDALPAGEIVRQIAQQARAVIANRLAPLVR
jgi:nitronate monooxygenase/enoyl-[acyl-carrier protein] reductase II